MNQNFKSTGHFIAGSQFIPAIEKTIDVFTSLDGSRIGSVPEATADTINQCVAKAGNAFRQWSMIPVKERVQVLFRFKSLLETNILELSELIRLENGKTLTEARAEIEKGIEVLEFATSFPQIYDQEKLEVSAGVDCESKRLPLGVVLSITPFNFPAMVPMWFFPIAIAAGNAVILKPSEKDPSAAIWMAKLWKEAGLPDGIFTVLNGDKEAVDGLINSPDIESISFVGSTPIAKYIYENCARTGKRVQALGGAKNHMLVLPDADLELVADSAINAGFGSAGERCMAISVAVLVGDVADKIMPKLIERTKTLKIKNGMELDAEMGPIVTKAALERITGYIDSGVTSGAKLLVDGRGLKVPGNENGFFLGGTLFDNVTPDMKIYLEEIFGPVLSCVRVANFTDALNLVNSCEYGNGVACFTSDGNIAREFARRVQVGMVGINVPIPVPMAWHGFGGWKKSLFGDMHAYGKEGVRFYTKQKSVMQRWPESIAKGAEFVMPTSK